jgi:DNA-binding response OmpR family regulator
MTSRKKILLVEDDASVLEILAMYLTESGFDVLTAADGMEALDVFQHHHTTIGVVLTDLGLPRLGGWEMFRQMKAIDPAVRALLASGYVDPQLRKEAIDLGAVDFLQKPYKPAEVLERLSSLLSTP